MQRRAVAVYLAIFLLVGTAAGALIATAESPEISFDDPDYELSEGETFEIDGVTYTVSDISIEEDEGDLGDVERETTGEIQWEELVQQSETWENDSIVTIDDHEWRVVIAGEDPTEFTLREQIDRQAVLEDDPNAANETVESDGEEFVVVTGEDGDQQLVHADDYFPDPEERAYAVGDVFDYDDQAVTVASITADEVTLEWEAIETMSLDLTQERQIELGGSSYVAFFPDESTLVLSSDLDAYQQQVEAIETFDQHVDGFWRIIIVSGLGVFLLVAAAFLPSRY